MAYDEMTALLGGRPGSVIRRVHRDLARGAARACCLLHVRADRRGAPLARSVRTHDERFAESVAQLAQVVPIKHVAECLA